MYSYKEKELKRCYIIYTQHELGPLQSTRMGDVINKSMHYNKNSVINRKNQKTTTRQWHAKTLPTYTVQTKQGNEGERWN